MVYFNKYNLIKIPNYIAFFYNKKYNFIILKFNKKLKLLNLYSFFCLLVFKNKLFLTINKQYLNSRFFIGESVSRLKPLFFNIKQFLFETEIKIYKKLKLIGVGYKVFPFKNFLYNMFLFKLGFSHNIFLKINDPIFSFCLKFTEVYIISNSIDSTNKICSLIKSFKLINIFIGKGILFYNEKFSLKKNKRI